MVVNSRKDKLVVEYLYDGIFIVTRMNDLLLNIIGILEM